VPCHDITDTLKIRLDDQDRIVRYSLIKRSCGGAVGRRALIGRWLKNRSAGEVLSFSAEVFLSTQPTRSKTWQYLLIKHFLAVQSGLAILLGRQSGSSHDYCTAESIEYGPEGTTLIAHVRVDAMTDQIKACQSCCGAKQHVSL
jgi:hypothetical protein